MFTIRIASASRQEFHAVSIQHVERALSNLVEFGLRSRYLFARREQPDVNVVTAVGGVHKEKQGHRPVTTPRCERPPAVCGVAPEPPF